MTNNFKESLFSELRQLATDKFSDVENKEIGQLKIKMDTVLPAKNLSILGEIVHKLMLHPISGAIQGYILDGEKGM